MGQNKKDGLFFAVDDSSAGKIVGGKRDLDLVAGDDADIVLAHLARKMGEYDVAAALELHPEHGVGKGFPNDALYLYGFFFGHGLSLENMENSLGEICFIRTIA
jgi:hypothetical protein